MAGISVSQAARQLGVGVARVHQRIADGSLGAQRVGSQWVVDELSALRVAECNAPGRPLSARSAWAIIALAEGDDRAMSKLAPVERSRATQRLGKLLAFASDVPSTEQGVRQLASALRRLFRNRAEVVLTKAAEPDLARLRDDPRWISIVSSAASGIASHEVDAYLTSGLFDAMSRDYLLVPADVDANVIIRVPPEQQWSYPSSKLRLAADLADRHGVREELRAVELLREVAHDSMVVT